MANAMVLLFFFLAITAADLQNPDFESPPTNITSNTSSSPVLLRNGINKIPGWSFNGTVWYVTSGPNISLPRNGHGVQLGQDGKINQTFKADENYNDFVLTFILAPGNKNCSDNYFAVNVSTPGRFKVFSLERRYGIEMWESHAFYFPSWDDKNGIINLEIQSVQLEHNASAICSPVVDTFMITKIETPKFYSDNLLANSGFEVGPSFLKNSTEGTLLNEEPDQTESPLQQWSIIGTVKYIDSRHYKIPAGKAAIEIVSSDPSGILTIPVLSKGSNYSLEFMMGDANDLCIGEFILWARAGEASRNYSLQSNGTGSAKKYSLTFVAEASLTPISFVSFNQSQRRDGVLCGPVIDNIILRTSTGFRGKILSIESLLVFLLVMIMLLN